jgi:mannose-6-phosphate isomerase-like protein (cupin superfamily)
MSYGLTLEQVRNINHPAALTMPWGSVASTTAMQDFGMYRVEVLPGREQPLRFFPNPYTAFIESGEVVVRSLDCSARQQAGRICSGKVLKLPRYHVHGLSSVSGAIIYIFGPYCQEGLQPFAVESEETARTCVGALNDRELPIIGEATSDVREKYWGCIETIMSEDVAAKRILVRKGGQSSLEFHVDKRESYYIHSGLLKLGLRIGRAENHSIVMGPGDSFDVRPGLMHMRMALEDTVIVEVSTKDSDMDSFLVEDGQTYRHIDSNLNRT